jgi:hypothetical protein
MNNMLSKIFAIVFVAIGSFMMLIGLSLLFSGPSGETEWTICIGSLLAAFFLFYGARQTWQNSNRQLAAERIEAERINQLRAERAAKPVSQNGEETVEAIEENNLADGQDDSIKETVTVKEKEVKKVDESKEEAHTPAVLAHWFYPKKEWTKILDKLAQKTKREELYTAFWFPVLFAIIFWSMFWFGILFGLGFGAIYVWFRTYFVKKKFAIQPNSNESEVLITDSYLYVNGNFIHYGDGKYYLKDLTQETDTKLGNLLCFNIGWLTSKGLPAQMDLYLPVPLGKEEEANLILQTFRQARK